MMTAMKAGIVKAEQLGVYFNDLEAGILIREKLEGGLLKYTFKYLESYLNNHDYPAVSGSLPKRKRAYVSDRMFPFFQGLLPEGMFRERYIQALGIKPHQDWELLKVAGRRPIGAVNVRPMES